MKNPIIYKTNLLANEWRTVKTEIVESIGIRNKSLVVSTRFDGNGNAVVRFIVTNEGKEISFTKFDSAATYYDSII